LSAWDVYLARELYQIITSPPKANRQQLDIHGGISASASPSTSFAHCSNKTATP
jgi:hypothetical protein